MNRKFWQNRLLVVLVAVLILTVIMVIPYHTERKQVCFSMISPDNSFANEFTKELSSRFSEDGTEVLISYCNNDVNQQISQIENYIAMNPSVMVIDCMGGVGIYDSLMAEAEEHGTKVIAMRTSKVLEHADIQILNSNVSRGICMAVMVSDFLDDLGVPEEEQVKALLLGDVSSESSIQIMAGYEMMTEKFIRYYDMNTLSFIKEEGERTYYVDGYGRKQEVEEPTGGLLLNEEGLAILNPYYEPRIQLMTADNFLNCTSNLEGQAAIDSFLGYSQNRDIQIVLAVNGEAAVGAARRLEDCLARHELVYDASKIAVFGADDTIQNRQLIVQAKRGQGVYRGFVGDFNVRENVDSLIRCLITNRKEIIEGYSFYSGYNPQTGETGIVVFYDTGVSRLDIFGVTNYDG